MTSPESLRSALMATVDKVCTHNLPGLSLYHYTVIAEELWLAGWRLQEKECSPSPSSSASLSPSPSLEIRDEQEKTK